jgi:hypothetical protein
VGVSALNYVTFLRSIHEAIGQACAYSRKGCVDNAENDLDFTDIAIKRLGHVGKFLLPSQSDAVPVTALMAVESSSADAEGGKNEFVEWHGGLGACCTGKTEKGAIRNNTHAVKFSLFESSGSLQKTVAAKRGRGQ